MYLNVLYIKILNVYYINVLNVFYIDILNVFHMNLFKCIKLIFHNIFYSVYIQYALNDDGSGVPRGIGSNDT